MRSKTRGGGNAVPDRTSQFSGPRLALLASAAERESSTYKRRLDPEDINDALLEHVHRRSTLDVVRQVVREELAPYRTARRRSGRR
jgi:hypothetical protein